MGRIGNTILLVLMFQLGAIKVLAQPKVSVESTLIYLNGLLKGNEELSVQGKYLIIKGFNDGTQAKEDKVNKYDLDPERIEYVPDQGVVTMKCLGDADACIERKSVLVNKKAYRNRVAFSVSGKEHGAMVVKGLTHLVRCFADNKYVGPESLSE